MLRALLATLGTWSAGAVLLRAIVIPAETCPALTPETALQAARSSAAWIERNQFADGTYLYEYDAGANRVLGGYNEVRHAGVTMSLYQLAAAGDASVLPAADAGMAWMTENLLRREGWAAFRDPGSGAVRLGASALMLAGLEQRRLATGDRQYDGLMRELGRFLVSQQLADGGFLEFYDPYAAAPVPGLRSKYATGEAFWALALLHEALPGEGWDAPTRRAADYLSFQRDEVEGQKFPPWADQWAAYGLAEMADWGVLSDGNIAYARALAERFGFLVRVESRRTPGWWSKLLRGPEGRAAGAGTWVEGLAALYRLASADARMAGQRDAIAARAVCMAGILAERQVTADELGGYDRPDIAEGAWFTGGKTRMDDQQHALSGLLMTAGILREGGAR